MFIVVSDYFPSCITSALICVKIVFNAYQISLTCEFPFIVFQTNVLYLTAYFTAVLLGIYSLIVNFSGVINRTYFLIAFFIFIFLSCMIIRFFLSLYYNTLKKNLSKTSLDNFYFDENNKSPISDNQKFARYQKM
jgi:hypothetical protein